MGVILKYKNIIIALIIIVVFAVVINNINSHYILQREQLKAKERELQNGKKTINKWNRLQGEFKKLSGKFFSKETLLLKKFVEKEAQDQKVEIISLNVSKVDKGFYWESLLRLSVVCPYDNLLRLINALEDKSIGIEGMRIEHSAQNVIKINATLKGIVIK